MPTGWDIILIIITYIPYAIVNKIKSLFKK